MASPRSTTWPSTWLARTVDLPTLRHKLCLIVDERAGLCKHRTRGNLAAICEVPSSENRGMSNPSGVTKTAELHKPSIFREPWLCDHRYVASRAGASTAKRNRRVSPPRQAANQPVGHRVRQIHRRGHPDLGPACDRRVHKRVWEVTGALAECLCDDSLLCLH